MLTKIKLSDSPTQLKAKFDSLLSKNKKSLNILVLVVTGFVFGVSVSIGTGVNREVSVAIGVVVALGVLLTGSIVGYLLFQTLVLATLAFVAYSAFRLFPSIFIDPELVQLTYAVAIFISPLLGFVPRIRKSLLSFANFQHLQLISVFAFAVLLRFVRIGRPSDSRYALSQMYYAEDNAGIVGILSSSLNKGYSPLASYFGEFFNGIYLFVAGMLKVFPNSDDFGLTSALTHWNLTSIFLAFPPLAFLVALVFTGKQLRFTTAITGLALGTALLVLLFWPFVALGHTSVITSGLMTMCLVALTLNRKLSVRHPVLFFVASLGLGFAIAVSWFPLMPFAAATVAMIFVAQILTVKPEQRIRMLIVLALLLTIAGTIVLPEILTRVSESSDYLEMTGATRSIGEPLILVWLTLVCLVVWTRTRNRNFRLEIGSALFSLLLIVLVTTNTYLFLSGLVANAGNPGYGASKYLLTSIASTVPLLWLVLVALRKKVNVLQVLASGLVLIFSVVIFQYDSRPVGSNFFAEQQPANTAVSQSGVYLALQEALSMQPDQIFCAADYGIPVPEQDISYDPYQCTRWAQSLVGDENGQEWRFVPLGRISEESLIPVLETYREKKVVIIRFQDPTSSLEIEQTWWAKYVDDSWEIVTVR
jgi:hypothetical protein